ncbi:4-hydroxy-tetrahydrodipicolinate reductase [Candidatus Saccharibacteria bacterium]|nr:4-hydroxy-tetrahydrodipicolinate reductase [Candidatus Saccharibacteria bacterium]
MIRVLVSGANGKMGQEVVQQISADPNFEVVAGFDRTANNADFPIYDDASKIKEKPDVIIDFSTPAATSQILDYAKENNIPIVIATTGFSEEELAKIAELAKEIPILRAANTSFEINLMAKLVADLAEKLPDSDIEITDIHHNRKADSPSGTALLLADSINQRLGGTKEYEFDRHSKRTPRKKKEIGIHSLRGGTVVGAHSVYFFGDNESFEIKHTVTSRSIFAKGALKAAAFLVSQPAGLYGMNDVIGD